MAQDIRRIVFSLDEVVHAVEAYRRVTPKFMPDGEIVAAKPGEDHSLVLMLETVKDDVSVQTPLILNSLDILKALVRFCLNNNIMLPRAGQKSFSVTNESACLNIRLDVNVPEAQNGAQPAIDLTPKAAAVTTTRV